MPLHAEHSPDRMSREVRHMSDEKQGAGTENDPIEELNADEGSAVSGGFAPQPEPPKIAHRIVPRLDTITNSQAGAGPLGQKKG